MNDGPPFIPSGIVFLDSLGDIGEKVFQARDGLRDILTRADERFGRIEGKVDNMDANVRSLKSDAIHTRRELGVLRGDVEKMKGEMGEMKKDITTMKGDITTMKGDINAMKGEISSLRVDIQALSSSLKEFIQNSQPYPTPHNPHVGRSIRIGSPEPSIPPEVEEVVDVLADGIMTPSSRDQARSRAMRMLRGLVSSPPVAVVHRSTNNHRHRAINAGCRTGKQNPEALLCALMATALMPAYVTSLCFRPLTNYYSGSVQPPPGSDTRICNSPHNLNHYSPVCTQLMHSAGVVNTATTRDFRVT